MRSLEKWMPYETHRIVAMVVGQDEDDVSRFHIPCPAERRFGLIRLGHGNRRNSQQRDKQQLVRYVR